jgi:plasmid replication initiation protein
LRKERKLAMAKRITEEARVLAFFRNAPVEVAKAIFGIVKEEVKGRLGEPGAFVKANGLVKKARKKRISTAASAAIPSGGAV